MKNIFITLYIFTLFLFAVFSYAFVDPNLFYFQTLYTGFVNQHRAITTFIYIAFVFIFFIFYILFLWWVNTKKLLMPEIRWLIIVTIIIFFLSYPAMLSYDIFNYLTTAKVAFFYHENPYIIMPIEFNGEPFLSFTRAANKIALYGPVWILLTGIPYILSFGNFLLLLYGLKLLVIVFYISTIYLIWKITRNSLPVVLFALNPLVVIETLVSGHNDIVMMFFALLAFYLFSKKKIFIVTGSLFVSILIKYATLLLLPIFFYVMYGILKGNKINWEKVYIFSAITMFVAFLAAPLREEMYPWYVVWVLAFVALVPKKKFLLAFAITLSFALLMRYAPVLYTGNYFGITPLIKSLVTFIPLILVILLWPIFRQKRFS